MLGGKDVEDCNARRSAHGIAAKSVEVLGSLGKRVRDGAGGDDGGEGHAVAHRLAHGDNVGHDLHEGSRRRREA